MSNAYRIIDETSYSVLGGVPTRGQAVDFIAALLSVNDDDFLDELTISNDDGPLLYGDSLRDALRKREAARKRTASSARGDGANGAPTAAMAIKSHRS